MRTRSRTPDAPPASAATAQDRSSRAATFQPEIQGLRALAVILVVIYHFWPERLSGGYVGVDVFFVISGYLITAHLFKEASTRGAVRLGRFWARRIRRLLPLSLLVLLLTAILTVLIMPSTEWSAARRQIIASTLYVQNWILAEDSVDYSKLDQGATAVQHFWSLSVEEQFYVLWPLLLALVLAVAALVLKGRQELTEPRVRRLFLWTLGLLAAASLVFSVWFTAQDQAQAYFVTPTRIWEFAAGGLLALIMGSRQFTGAWGNLLGWLGLAMVLASAVFYDDQTPFPGWTALLPVLGTVLMILCGGKQQVTGMHWWMSLKPATKLGDWSYAIYLWHWPVVVMAPYVHEGAELFAVQLVLIGGIIVVSALSTEYFEKPLRYAKIILPTGRSLAAAAAGMAVVISTAYWTVEQEEQGASEPELSEDQPCYGFRALENPEECTPPEGDMGLYPSPAEVAQEPQNPVFPDCQADAEEAGLHECWLGVEEEDAEGTIAVFGDSHATMWLPALDAIAQQEDKQLLVMTRSACSPRASLSEGEDPCGEANLEILDRVADDDDIGTVVMAASQKHSEFGDPEVEVDLPEGVGDSSTGASMLTPIQYWLDADKDVVVFGETPRMNEERDEDETLPECVDVNRDDLTACHDDLEDTHVGDRWLTQSEEIFADEQNYHFVGTEDLVCDEDEETCYAVLGGAITYNDNSHLSQGLVRSVTDEIHERMEPAL